MKNTFDCITTYAGKGVTGVDDMWFRISEQFNFDQWDFGALAGYGQEIDFLGRAPSGNPYDFSSINYDLYGAFRVGDANTPDAAYLSVGGSNLAGSNLTTGTIREILDISFTGFNAQTGTFDSIGADFAIFNATIRARDFKDVIETVDATDDRELLAEELSSADIFDGSNSNDVIRVFGGADVVVGGGGSDILDGGAGYDIAAYFGDRSDFTIRLSANQVIVTDRAVQDGPRLETPFILIDLRDEGTDILLDVEALTFNNPTYNGSLDSFEPLLDGQTGGFGEIYNIANLEGIFSLTEGQITEIAELYVAYFNRAPDVEGLLFWANEVAAGLDIPTMARLFADQNETRALYPTESSTSEFVTAVYENVLGRAPDAAGNAFWSALLEDGSVSRPSFIIEIIAGAKAATGSVADADFLATKTDIGIHFSLIDGQNNADRGTQVMEAFDGTGFGFSQAVSLMEQFDAQAQQATGGEFQLEVVGAITDPLANLF